jgi:hypothetical protein
MAAETKEVDLINRDPDNMNGYVHIQFDDVFAEPHSWHSKDW